jgi:surface antigen/LysM repeat protein
MAAVLLSVVFLGQPGRTERESGQTRLGGLGGDTVAALDEVSAAKIAADIAKGADLIVADNVQNLVDSQLAQVDFVTNEGAYLAKPQLVATEAKTNRDIIRYEVQPGDTVPKIARRFNITSDTIRWENDLTGDSVAAGQILRILPISGIRYTVQEGDDARSIANRFGLGSSNFLVAFNDAEVRGFKTGDKIIIPGGRRQVVQPTFFSSGSSGFAFGSSALYGSNGYSYGYCTWWAANRRTQTGRPVPTNLGNAITWRDIAIVAGYSVNQKPRAGDVAWYGFIGGLGHVGYVEKVNGDGSIWISDMNYQGQTSMSTGAPGTGGWNVVSYHLVRPSEFGQYFFIH